MSSKNKRLALLVSSLRAGGGEKMMVEIAGGLANLGYEVDLVIMKNDGQLRGQISSEINTVDLNVRRMAFAWINLIKYLRNRKPHAIMALDEYTHLTALFAVKVFGGKTRVILRIGNMYSELFRRYYRLKDKILPVLIRYFYNKADDIVAVSLGVADDIIKVARLDPKKVVVIYNSKQAGSVLAKTKTPIGHVWVERKNTPLIVAVGRLREQKNFNLLIKAFNQVRQEIRCRLIIVGVGREEDRLRNLTRELRCDDDVSFPGYTSNPYRYMSKADVFVSTSLWEGLPNGLVEALICGVPIVASDCNSGPREILSPKADYNFRLKIGLEWAEFGVLYAVNDQESLSQAILKILSENNLRGQYILASQKRAQAFDFNHIIRQYELILTK